MTTPVDLPVTRLTLLAWYALLIAGCAFPPLWIILVVWAVITRRRHTANVARVRELDEARRQAARYVTIRRMTS